MTKWMLAVLPALLVFLCTRNFCVGVQESPRERIPLNDGWRFQRDDPPGSSVALLYDVRPEVQRRSDDGPADARPEEAVTATAPAQAVLKPWILPAGSAFSGLCLVIVRGKAGQSGSVRLAASSQGMPDAVTFISTTSD